MFFKISSTPACSSNSPHSNSSNSPLSRCSSNSSASLSHLIHRSHRFQGPESCFQGPHVSLSRSPSSNIKRRLVYYFSSQISTHLCCAFFFSNTLLHPHLLPLPLPQCRSRKYAMAFLMARWPQINVHLRTSSFIALNWGRLYG